MRDFGLANKGVQFRRKNFHLFHEPSKRLGFGENETSGDFHTIERTRTIPKILKFKTLHLMCCDTN